MEIQAGGRSLIRVTDDGLGMSRDDALLCLERHATSKIRRAEDLSAIATMGFRGEALPSIASVSRLSLTTRERDGDTAATQVVINGGKIVEVREAGGAAGHLHGGAPAVLQPAGAAQVPAQRRNRIRPHPALPHPGRAGLSRGRLHLHQGRPGGLAAAAGDPGRHRHPQPPRRPARTHARLLGGEQELLAVDRSPEHCRTADGLRPKPDIAPAPVRPVWGFIGAPGVSRATREDQHLFVNRRPVENRGLELRAARRLPHRADERPLPGLLPVPGNRSRRRWM